MPPCRDESLRPTVMVAPRVPEAVHLMTEAYNNWTPERGDVIGEGLQVGVVPPRGYPGQPDVGRVNLHERGSAMAGRRLSESLLERFLPATVIGDQVRSPSDVMSKLLYTSV